MAGHSKWANIKHRKAAQDAKRGKIFTKHIREITVAAREGGGDPDANPRLRIAVDKALGANMTRDTVERAIKRGTGDLEGVSYEDIRYEGYGPCGIAVLVECSTDNKNRTVAEVRHAFSKYNGNMGTEGSVAYMFEKLGVILLSAGADEEAVMDVALEAGAEDIVTHEDGSIEITSPPENHTAVESALMDASIDVESAEVVQRAANEISLNDEDAEKVMRLIDALEDLDDVQDVFTNADFPDSIFAEA
ncbi:putative transcriptional regulatory protein [Arenicella chitinivorans]|uniref:Probable transcriptional regulatory protein GCM10008090_22120 n=1 Tax=Arenicella chitinivorans TaxID=1329800 RepID=A0A918VN75_9GAMM|nr:YebC/PmpR family DNA-binding transcriptional regulator [Arenicella chitinivorans]GHA11891.1 putative transcriptional regulatory protein [Arenicella chitinivorans]